MIENYITDVCKLLKIQIPFISYNTSHFTTKTMMAQCSSDGSTIYLNKIDRPNPDYMFAIAHKLRHVWQIQTDQVLYFSDYKPIELSYFLHFSISSTDFLFKLLYISCLLRDSSFLLM